MFDNQVGSRGLGVRVQGLGDVINPTQERSAGLGVWVLLFLCKLAQRFFKSPTWFQGLRMG